MVYEKIKKLKSHTLALEIMEDHVHFFVSCPPTLEPD
ncbi:MAG: hypothetical protein GC195_06460 [Nostoc sp. RI_552]|nr:hypothetical protein [Nostoc sp. RI_552]